jgi:hypothetical protein
MPPRGTRYQTVSEARTFAKLDLRDTSRRCSRNMPPKRPFSKSPEVDKCLEFHAWKAQQASSQHWEPSQDSVYDLGHEDPPNELWYIYSGSLRDSRK